MALRGEESTGRSGPFPLGTVFAPLPSMQILSYRLTVSVCLFLFVCFERENER